MVMMKHSRLYIVSLLTLVFALISPATLAANLWVTVSKNKVVKNEVFQLRIVADEKVSVDDIDLSVLNQDFYVGRPSFGTSINIVNSQRTTRSEWNIQLAAQRLGSATIPAFSLNGATSEPIAIQVSMDQDEPKISDLIELQNTLNKQQLYPNESAVLNTRLIIKADPRRLQNPSVIPPQASGLTLDAIGEPNQYQSVLDGIEVTIVEQSYRVTADTSGEFTLSGIGFSGSVVYGNNRTGTTKLISANTPAEQLEISVLPIPTQFQGHWLPASALNLKQQWRDSDGKAIEAPLFTTQVGESLTREITLDINGVTSERFPDINTHYPSSVRLYQEKPQFSQLSDGSTRMTIKQVIIPQQQGEIALNDIKINWWNSQSKQEETATVAGLSLQVAAGSLMNAAEPELMPIASAPAESITIKDPGFWPYLSAALALLWLSTLALLIKGRHRSASKPIQAERNTLGDIESIETAIKQSDTVKVQYLVKQWLTDNAISDTELKSKIEQELNAMNRSQYSPDKPSWQGQTLMKLLKQAKSSREKQPHNEQPLAKL
ncbi:BatD family protein [Vibrio sinaloensis]